MTNENENNVAKRNNRVNDIVTLDLNNKDSVFSELQKVQEQVNATPNCKIFDVSGVFGEDEEGNTTIDFSLADTHDLQIIPSYSSDEKKQLVNVAIALTPKFDEVLKSEIGLKYLKDSYFAKVIKKIRDNLRQAILDGREYHLATEISDFLTPSRQPSQSAELKEAISNLVKMLVAKFATKMPYTKPLLTIKTMTAAISNESFAKQVYPFLICKDGETILNKWLDSTIADFEKRGVNTSELIAIKDTRMTEAEPESDNVDIDDLF